MEIKLDPKTQEIFNRILTTLQEILLEEKTQTRMSEDFFKDINDMKGLTENDT